MEDCAACGKKSSFGLRAVNVFKFKGRDVEDEVMNLHLCSTCFDDIEDYIREKLRTGD